MNVTVCPSDGPGPRFCRMTGASLVASRVWHGRQAWHVTYSAAVTHSSSPYIGPKPCRVRYDNASHFIFTARHSTAYAQHVISTAPLYCCPPIASRSQRVSLIVIPFRLSVWMSVGHSATYSLPRFIDHNQIWSAGIYRVGHVK